MLLDFWGVGWDDGVANVVYFLIRLDDFFVVTTSDFASLKCEASVGCSNLFEFWIIKVYYSNSGAFFFKKE